MWRNTQNTHLPCSPISIKSPSLRKVTCMVDAEWYMEGYFNPHLPCGRWPATEDCVRYVSYISIHTFLAEGDVHYVISVYLDNLISIHIFLAEGDEKADGAIYRVAKNFNPHFPCGRWQMRAAKEEQPIVFQSTPSLRKVTSMHFYVAMPYKISIHTFLTEGDDRYGRSSRRDQNFNPHLPYGRWPKLRALRPDQSDFNPHLPYGRWLAFAMLESMSALFQSTPSLRKVTYSPS